MFDGLGGNPIQINPNLWAVLLPELKVVLANVEFNKTCYLSENLSDESR